MQTDFIARCCVSSSLLVFDLMLDLMLLPWFGCRRHLWGQTQWRRGGHAPRVALSGDSISRTITKNLELNFSVNTPLRTTTVVLPLPLYPLPCTLQSHNLDLFQLTVLLVDNGSSLPSNSTVRVATIASYHGHNYHRALGAHTPIISLDYFETELPMWNLQT